MWLTKKARAKATLKAQALLGEGAIQGLAFGETGPNPTYTTWGLIGGAILIFAMTFAIFRVGIFVGGLIIFAIRYYVNPPRCIVIADRGVALLKRGAWSVHPTELVAKLPHDITNNVVEDSGSRLQLNLGVERVWVTKKEYAHLQLATRRLPQQPLPQQPSF